MVDDRKFMGLCQIKAPQNEGHGTLTSVTLTTPASRVVDGRSLTVDHDLAGAILVFKPPGKCLTRSGCESVNGFQKADKTNVLPSLAQGICVTVKVNRSTCSLGLLTMITNNRRIFGHRISFFKMYFDIVS